MFLARVCPTSWALHVHIAGGTLQTSPIEIVPFIGMNITISLTQWPAPSHFPYKYRSLSRTQSLESQKRKYIIVIAYNKKLAVFLGLGWNIQLQLAGFSSSQHPTSAAIPGATTRARTNFFQRRVALRQLCKASSKCATKARIISETWRSWLVTCDISDILFFHFVINQNECVKSKSTLKLICREESIIFYWNNQGGKTHRSCVGKLVYSHCQISKMCVATWGQVFSQGASVRSVRGLNLIGVRSCNQPLPLRILMAKNKTHPEASSCVKIGWKDLKLTRTSSKTQEALENIQIGDSHFQFMLPLTLFFCYPFGSWPTPKLENLLQIPDRGVLSVP